MGSSEAGIGRRMADGTDEVTTILRTTEAVRGGGYFHCPFNASGNSP